VTAKGKEREFVDTISSHLNAYLKPEAIPQIPKTTRTIPKIMLRANVAPVAVLELTAV
jgi:hypothetical protein